MVSDTEPSTHSFTMLALSSPHAARKIFLAARMVDTPMVMELMGVLSMVPKSLDASLREALSSRMRRALFVEAAVFEDGVFGNGAVGAEDVLAVDVDVVEEHFLQCVEVAVDGFGGQGIVFIQVEYDYVPEAESLFAVHADECRVDIAR